MNKKLKKQISYTIVFLALLSFTLGFLGWHEYHLIHNKAFSIGTGLFLSLQLFTINTSFEHILLPWPLEIARFLAPVSLASAVLNAFFMFFYRKSVQFLISFFFRKHYIFNSMNVYSLKLIEDILKDKNSKVVVLEEDERKISSIQIQSKRFKVLNEDPAGATGLLRAGINKAMYLMAMSDNDIENMAFIKNAIDATNAAVKKNTDKPQQTKHAFIKLNEPDNLLLFNDFEYDDLKLDLHAFNYYRKCAAYVVDEFAPDTHKPVQRNDDQVQVLLVGFNNAAAHLLTEAVQMYHFANLKKTKFIITDNDVNQKYREYYTRYPMVEHAADIERVELEECLSNHRRLDFANIRLILICCENDALSTNMALKFRQRAYQATGKIEQPVIVAVHKDSQLLSTLVGGIPKIFKDADIKLVNYLAYFNKTRFIDDKQKDDVIAKYIDAYYAREYEKQYQGNDLTENQIEDRWVKMPDRTKESNRLPARHYKYKLRVLNAELLKKDDPEKGHEIEVQDVDAVCLNLLAKMEKNRWNAEKYMQGFVTGEYNQDKALEKKLKNSMKYHPVLKPWEEISQEERDKDYKSIENITSILRKAGHKVVKVKPAVKKT